MSITDPLTNLLKKGNFLWDSQAITAFERLKTVIIEAPILALPASSKPFVLETSASG